MSDKKYRRNLFLNEKLSLAFSQQGSPMAYVVIIEGIGDISDETMNEALRKLSMLYPILRSRISGCLKTLHWEESDHFPQFIRMGTITSPFSDWPSPEEKKIFQKKTDLKKDSPVAAYSLSDGQKMRLYFKIHHTVMDGAATYLLIHELFKILRDEEPLGPNEEPETIKELYDITLPDDFFERRSQEALKDKSLKSETQEKEGGSKFFNGVYEGKHMISPPSKDNNIEWYSLLIPNDKITLSKLNGKLISAVMETLKKLNPGLENKKFQSFVPVNLRYLLPGLRKASNLTGVIAVELDKYFDVPIKKRAASINNDIKEQIKNGWAISKPLPILDWVPLKLFTVLTFIFRKIAFYRRISPYYFYFSNVGRVELNNVSTESFKAERVFAVTTMHIYCPFSILMLTHDNGVELLCITDTDKKAFAGFMNLLKKEIASLEEKLEGGEM